MATGLQHGDDYISIIGETGMTIQFNDDDTLKITNCYGEDTSRRVYRFTRCVDINHVYEDGFLRIRVDNHDFMIIETEELALNDFIGVDLTVIDPDTYLSAMRHLLSVDDFNELDDAWDN